VTAGFLHVLAQRAIAVRPQVAPRVAALFEPINPGSPTVVADVSADPILPTTPERSGPSGRWPEAAGPVERDAPEDAAAHPAAPAASRASTTVAEPVRPRDEPVAAAPRRQARSAALPQADDEAAVPGGAPSAPVRARHPSPPGDRATHTPPTGPAGADRHLVAPAPAPTGEPPPGVRATVVTPGGLGQGPGAPHPRPATPQPEARSTRRGRTRVRGGGDDGVPVRSGAPPRGPEGTSRTGDGAARRTPSPDPAPPPASAPSDEHLGVMQAPEVGPVRLSSEHRGTPRPVLAPETPIRPPLRYGRTSPPPVPAAEPAPTPSVSVTIGRIEVRAVTDATPAARPARAERAAARAVSLEEYLQQRSRGSRA
jgi:hypothetical protein